MEAARGIAREILAETRSAKVANVIAWQEMVERNYDAVKEWVALAEEIGCGDLDYLLLVKYYCCGHVEEYDIGEISEEILACNYLPMEYTREALVGKAGELMFKAKFQECISFFVTGPKRFYVFRYFIGV